MTDLLWPERPTCHGEAPRFSQSGASWRPPRGRRGNEDPSAETWRTCWYCGSIHPEDLYDLLAGHERVDYSEFDAGGYSGAPEEYMDTLRAHYRAKDAAGIHVGGSDWKYGWPHKFYIDGIPNPVAGEEYVIYTTTGSIEGKEDADEWEEFTPDYNPYGGTSFRKLYSRSACPSTTRAKWYNEHLNDLVPETFAVFAPLLAVHSGITFSLTDEGKLHYAAPYRGFQH